MVQINFAQKQINAKIVYYGPGMSGKTTNLEVVHQRAPDKNRGELTSISTDGDRTLFFDYMPLDLGTIAGMKTCFQMYTVPGQVYYNSTRKLVLQGVDGVIFVADSSPDAMEANLESLRNLEENLNEYGKSLSTLPHVVQFNKRDIPGALGVEQMMASLNPHGVPTFEAIAATGQGVFPTLKGLASLVLKNIQAECASPSGGLAGTGFRRTEPAAAAPQPAQQQPVQQQPVQQQPPQPVQPQPVQQPMQQPAAAQAPMPAPQPQPMAGQMAAGAPELHQTGVHPQAAAPQAPLPQGQAMHQTGFHPQAYPQPAQAEAATQAAPRTGAGDLMRTQSRPAPRSQTTPKRRPAGSQSRAKSRTPAPAPAPAPKGGMLKTAAFVVGAAAVGAVVAHFVLGAL
jgi:signal recognition particle receptor subunit beta